MYNAKTKKSNNTDYRQWFDKMTRSLFSLNNIARITQRRYQTGTQPSSSTLHLIHSCIPICIPYRNHILVFVSLFMSSSIGHVTRKWRHHFGMNFLSWCRGLSFRASFRRVLMRSGRSQYQARTWMKRCRSPCSEDADCSRRRSRLEPLDRTAWKRPSWLEPEQRF